MSCRSGEFPGQLSVELTIYWRFLSFWQDGSEMQKSGVRAAAGQVRSGLEPKAYPASLSLLSAIGGRRIAPSAPIRLWISTGKDFYRIQTSLP
jgi:hypothetical protein